MTDRAGSVRALTVGVVLTLILSPVTGLVAAESTAPGSHPAPDTDGVDVTGGPESTAGLLVESVSPERALSYTPTVAEDTGDRGGNDTENRTVAPGGPPTVAIFDIRGLEPRTVEANETLAVGIVTENTGSRGGDTNTHLRGRRGDCRRRTGHTRLGRDRDRPLHTRDRQQ